MTPRSFKLIVGGVGVAFAVTFFAVVAPPLIQDPNVIGAFAAGFVNPYASGYAIDAICSWVILASWVAYEAKSSGVKHGWIAIALGIAPGVATGLAFYLLLRMRQGRN